MTTCTVYFQSELETYGEVLFEDNVAEYSGGALWVMGNSKARLSGPKVAYFMSNVWMCV